MSGMENKTPLLSVCIPTYNRADKLGYSLKRILESSVEFSGEIEIIVSDNASNDGTSNVISKLKTDYPFLKAYRNETNIGFNGNFFRITDEYATGYFIWVVGDDDIIDAKAFRIILPLLEKNMDLKLLSLSSIILPLQKAVKRGAKPISKNDFVIDTAMHSIDQQSTQSTILATFISCNIIEKSIYSTFDKAIFSLESWTNSQSLFPHSYMIAKSMPPTSKAMYIREPLVSVILDEKDWDDKLPILHLRMIVDLYNLYKHEGYQDLTRTKKNIIKSGTKYLMFKTSRSNDKKYFLQEFPDRGLYFFYAVMRALVYKILRKPYKYIKKILS